MLTVRTVARNGVGALGSRSIGAAHSVAGVCGVWRYSVPGGRVLRLGFLPEWKTCAWAGIGWPTPAKWRHGSSLPANVIVNNCVLPLPPSEVGAARLLRTVVAEFSRRVLSAMAIWAGDRAGGATSWATVARVSGRHRGDDPGHGASGNRDCRRRRDSPSAAIHSGGALGAGRRCDVSRGYEYCKMVRGITGAGGRGNLPERKSGSGWRIDGETGFGHGSLHGFLSAAGGTTGPGADGWHRHRAGASRRRSSANGRGGRNSARR